MNDVLSQLTEALRGRADAYERERRWPRESLADYGALDGWRWGLPSVYGGLEWPAEARLRGYVAAARGDMSAALFITQHEGAADLLATSCNEPLRERWLPRFAAGEALTTIGYSQLTTSRQGGAPAMRATPCRDGYTLDGVMPWVTGAPHVDNVACGAVVEGVSQVVVLLPLDARGVRIEPPAELAALNSTFTCVVHCTGVAVGREAVIAGPKPNVLDERTPVRLLLVSATGIGLAWSMVDALGVEAQKPSNRSMPGGWGERVAAVGATCEELESRLLGVAATSPLEQERIDRLRVDINVWLQRLAGALMVAAKGTGYLAARSAQRLAREALFFCVWSASDRVRAATADGMLAWAGIAHLGRHQAGRRAGGS